MERERVEYQTAYTGLETVDEKLRKSLQSVCSFSGESKIEWNLLVLLVASFMPKQQPMSGAQQRERFAGNLYAHIHRQGFALMIEVFC